MTLRVFTLLALALLPGSVLSQTSERPNVVFILADDIGYGDLGCQGAVRVRTPNLDRLAREGCRFTDAHSPAATCTPTRYALLTGQYAWRHDPGARILPGDAALCIKPGVVTLPSLMQKAGYRTGVVGKWHLGLGEGRPDFNTEIRPGPLDIGFDYAFLLPGTGDRVPCVYVEDRRVVGLDPSDPIQVRYGQKIGTEPTGRENPELLTLKPTHGHDNTIVRGVSRIGFMTGGKAARWVDEEMSDTFASKAVGFIEKNKERPFFLYLATHGIHVPRVPHKRFRGTSGCGTRGDAIHELDDAVGQVLAALDQRNLTEKTLVIFTSDNGGVLDDGYEDFGDPKYPCNGMLRGWKATLYEGGHRVPFLARWPKVIRPGTTSAHLMAHLDMPATLAALVGTPLPMGGAPDSVNVLAALKGEASAKGRETLVSHIGGTNGPFAIRHGNWKLIPQGVGKTGRPAEAAQGIKGGANGPQLFDLDKDVSESHNLASSHPEKVQQMQALLQKIRQGSAAGRP